jgi:hypothetical protein
MTSTSGGRRAERSRSSSQVLICGWSVTLEGPAGLDDPDEAYETVDVGEYFGGIDVATAHTLVLTQLKYSTRDPDAAWTAERSAGSAAVGAPTGLLDQPVP